MSTEKTWQTVSSSSDATFAIGEQFGRACKGGEVFLLTSDVGGGKTTFTKGLARGLGVEAIVTSPTFTISRIYPAHNSLQLHHFDFYRLSEGGMVAHELAEVINDPKAVIVIEWGDVVNGILPEDRITIAFDRTKKSEDQRSLKVTYSEKFTYVCKDIA